MTTPAADKQHLEELRTERNDGTADQEPYRTPYERDEDRLLYASSFRRLAGITQVVPTQETALVHNRLTHSMKVGQVAKRAASHLLLFTEDARVLAGGGLDPDVLNAAGLAHDLGHPPFGHIAEVELQRLLEPGKPGRPLRRADSPDEFSTKAEPLLVDSFEGNAQTFRIVTKLAARKARAKDGTSREVKGLGFTRATLAATLKYPWLKGQHPTGPLAGYFVRKWGAYNAEQAELEWAKALIPDGLSRTLEADIMDWADDVTYAVHDIEDFFRAGTIPLHEIRASADRISHVASNFWDYAVFKITTKGEIEFDTEEAKREWRDILAFLPIQPYRDGIEDRLALHEFCSKLVERFQRGLSIRRSGELAIQPPSKMLIEVLKQLTWYFVIDRPSLSGLQRGQAKVIRELFWWLMEWVEDSYERRDEDKHQQVVHQQVVYRKNRLPARLKDFVDLCHTEEGSREAYPAKEQRYARGIVDYIASLTETQAVHLRNRLAGIHDQPALGMWPSL